MIRAEYLRFLKTLKDEECHRDVYRIANLVLQHLDTLIPLTTSKGQRVKKIVEIAQKNWTSLSQVIEVEDSNTEKVICPFTIMKNLSVGPFRGFEKQENFNLSNQYVLVYGPNGTGKSSFCEALEYCLLGSVSEAESNRYRNLHEYLKNAHIGQFSKPKLMGIDNQGCEAEIVANEALYRFCFIEKNRIDNFSRIAAQAPAKQTELISSLFGLDDFTEFVRNFTDFMDDRYIDLKGIKSIALRKKMDTLAGSQAQLNNIIPEEIKLIDEAKKSLALKYKPNCTYENMIIELNGTDEEKGLINQLEEDLQKQIGSKSNLTVKQLHETDSFINKNLPELSTNKSTIESLSDQISFMNLYKAIIGTKSISGDKCPACHTPLSDVVDNPFTLAELELCKLNKLAELQTATQSLSESINLAINSLAKMISTCCTVLGDQIPLVEYQKCDDNIDTIKWWKFLHQQQKNDITPYEVVANHIQTLEEMDKNIDVTKEESGFKRDRLKLLRDIYDASIKINAREDTAIRAKEKHTQIIGDFNDKNKDLITEAGNEETTIYQNNEIATAYKMFIQNLQNYTSTLPSQLIADLGQKVVELYNSFNRHDSKTEQLAEIILPLQQNDNLKISFAHDPEKYFDALCILSEGHIRCIGLAILAAKNLKEQCPVLIFDDPVNAIDDDHRESIRKTLYEDKWFQNKQIILACHGEEFLKDIQCLLPAEKAKQVVTISFLPKNDNTNICVKHNGPPRNYIVSARVHYSNNEIRDALDKSRKALELLATEKIWQYVKKHSDGCLTLRVRSAKDSFELRNLVEQLQSKISSAKFIDKNKNDLLEPLRSLLGPNGDTREWRYLNKGTHEEADRIEFDRHTVSEIIAALEKIDSVLSKSK